MGSGLAAAYATDQRRLIEEAADRDEAQKAEDNRRFNRKKAANAVGIDIKVTDDVWMASTDDVFLRDVARRLKSDPDTQGIPIILLSAKAQQADIQAGTATGAEEYLTKPFDPLELLQRVGELIARKR